MDSTKLIISNKLEIPLLGPYGWQPLRANFSSEEFGIYIWGFFLEEKFIPYYVGKKEGRIVKRLEEHRDNTRSLKSTYKRPRADYFRKFYYDPDFEDNCYSEKVEDAWLNSRGIASVINDWFYINRPLFFKYYLKSAFDANKNYTIDDFYSLDQRDENGADIFRAFIKDDNNDKFGAMFLPVKNSKTELKSLLFGNAEVKDQVLLDLLESLVKYSLKGKTVSQSMQLVDLKDLLAKRDLEGRIMIEEGQENIFKLFENKSPRYLEPFNKRLQFIKATDPY